MSKFKDGVIKIVNLIPKGKVVSYGQVALYLGLPRAARQVGWILNAIGDKIEFPWWRVVNNDGRISIKSDKFLPLEQKRFLVKEGLKVKKDLTFNIEKYRFSPDLEFVMKLGLDPVTLELISKKIPYNKPHVVKR